MTWNYTDKELTPDKKCRLGLSAVIEKDADVRYRVAKNEKGQILLDPVTSIPAYEAWIYKNPERIESIMRGVVQAEAGDVVSINLGPDEPDEEEDE